MKTRLTTLDIVSLIKELQESLLGLRVDQIYDIDKKTYLIRLTKTDVKKILVLESGARFHTTTFEWPKNPAPSGFSMKLRKHINNKRLEKISQLGADRIVDFQFGTESFTHHILLELYDKGNIILTDYNYNILSLLRPRIQGEERLAAHERYAVEKAKQDFSLQEQVVNELVVSNPGKSLREIFISKVEFGPALFSYVLNLHKLAPSTKIPSTISITETDTDTETVTKEFSTNLFKALEDGRMILENFKPTGGFITLTSGESGKSNKKKNQQQKQEEEVPPTDVQVPLFYDQFHPTILLPNFENVQSVKFDSFDATVDDFFSKIESQKLEMRQLNQEKDALKKLEKVKTDQLKRLEELKVGQEVDKRKAEIISMNQNLVDAAISAIRKLVANQISWSEIWEQIELAKNNGDPLASTIQKLNLIRNEFTMALRDPYESSDDDDDEDEEDNDEDNSKKVFVDIDLHLSAYANATKYYDLKRQSAKKEERTLESQDKAFKSTEKKTMATLKEVATIQSIKKARKVYWFEKFKWFVSSENYLVLAGRDAQQNELLVKRYLKPRDAYLHADAHGAPTVIIKNDTPEQQVLPKTLNEAGCFAVSSSGSWDSKILTTCYWVFGDQVSKSAPTGEYLPTGSFMIRGKKNYLPPTQLVLGFGFLFRLTDESIEKHKNERPRRLHLSSSTSSSVSENFNSGAPSSIVGKTNIASKAQGDNEKDNLKPVQVDLKGKEEEKEDSLDGEFPDTQVKLRVGDSLSKQNRVRTQTISSLVSSSDGVFHDDTASSISNVGGVDDDESQTVIISCGTGHQPVVLSAQKMKRDKKRADKKGVETGKKFQEVTNKKVEEIETIKNETTNTSGKGDSQQQPQKPKRGQHGRNKKLKEKYKDQDDEDRELRMKLLKGMDGGGRKGNKGKNSQNKNAPPPPPQHVQNQKGPASGKNVPQPNKSTIEKVIQESVEQKDSKPVEEQEKQQQPGGEINNETTENSNVDSTPNSNLESVKHDKKEEHVPEPVAEEPEEEEEEVEEGTQEAEKNILNSLTSSPQEDDEILFAIPVIAPYSTLQNYKFRIKMVPGTTKRGKAARSALESFLRDKSASQREKDLLKAVKDVDLARNFPGKVKLSSGHDKR